MVIDDKWGEIVYKDSEKTTKGGEKQRLSDWERIWHRGRDMIKEGDQLKLKFWAYK